MVVAAVAAVGATAAAVFYLKKCRQRQQERRESVTSAVSKKLSQLARPHESKRPSQDSGQSHSTDPDDLVATAGALDPFADVQSRHNPM